MSIVFECRDLHKRFAVGAGNCGASAHVLRGIDLVLRAGECLAIVGPRGSGKSTLLLCAARLLQVPTWAPHGGSAKPRRRSRRADGVPLDRRGLRSMRVQMSTSASTSSISRSRRTGRRVSRVGSKVSASRDRRSCSARATNQSRVRWRRGRLLAGGRLDTAARADAASRVAEPVV